MIDPMKMMNELMNMKTYTKLFSAYQILFFYLVVMMVTSTLGYVNDNKNGFTDGLFMGMIISLFLWNKFGRSMAYV
jgi:hypothetical protein